MSVRQSGSKHTSGRRDPIAELTARIARLRKNLGKTSSRGKGAQANLIKTLEKRLTKLQQNKNQFGNIYGNRKNDKPIGRSVSKNKVKIKPEKIRDDDGNLKKGIWQTWDTDSDKTTTHKGFPKKDGSNQVKVNNNKTTVEQKDSKVNKEVKPSSNKEKLKTGFLSKVKKALKPGMSERQLKSQIRSLKRGSKGPSNRMKIKRLQELKKKKYG